MATSIISYDGQTYKSESYGINHLLVEQVMNSTNDSAVDFLLKFGDVNLFPIQNCTTAKEIAAFYGVSESYIKNVLTRHGVTQKGMPEEVSYCGNFTIMAKLYHEVKRIGVHYNQDNKPDGMQITDKTGKEILVRTGGKSFCVYSAKVFLAVAAMMCFEKRIENSMAWRVYNALLRSEYGERAKAEEQRRKREVDEMLRKQREAAKALEANAILPEVVAPGSVAKVPEPETVQPTPEVPTVLVTAELFESLLYTAVKSALKDLVAPMIAKNQVYQPIKH